MLHLQIITPEKVALDTEVDQVSLPTSTGQITILPHHVSLVTKIIPGELIYKKASKEEILASGFGFAEIGNTVVKVLVDLAAYETDIEEKKIEEAKKKAEEAIAQKHLLSDEEFATAAGNLQKALAQLKIKRRRYR